MIILAFELFVIFYAVGLYLFMRQKQYKNVTRKFIILFFGVLFFEIISEPMWLNPGFDKWAYIYGDVTWIFTLGWLSVYMTSMILIDYFYGRLSAAKRFFMYILVAEAFIIPMETFLIQSGVRGYASVLLNNLSGILIPYTQMPLEALLAFPMFTALIITFYKYMNRVMAEKC